MWRSGHRRHPAAGHRRGCRAERDVRGLRHIFGRRDPRTHHRRVELAARLLSWRFPIVRRFASPQRLTLIQRGVPQRRNLRREFITMDELNEKLREQGIEKMTGCEGRLSRRRRADQRHSQSRLTGSGLHCTEAGSAKPAGARKRRFRSDDIPWQARSAASHISGCRLHRRGPRSAAASAPSTTRTAWRISVP